MTQLLLTFLPCAGSELCRRAHHVQTFFVCQHQRMQHQIRMYSYTRHYNLSSHHHDKPSLASMPKHRHEKYHTYMKQHKILTHQIPVHFHTNTATAKQKGELTFENILCETNRRRVSEQLDTVEPVRKSEMLGMNTKAKNLKKKTKISAVLVPLCVVDGEPSLVFTLRSSSLRQHRGEVSFPGGNKDESDPDHIHTALRETFEEIGLNPRYFDVWGSMIPSPNRHKAGYMTYPVLAQYTKELDLNLNDLTINREEVEEVFTCSIRDLCEGMKIKAGSTQFRTGHGYTLPVYVGAPHRIWGLSAIILHQVLTLLAPGLYTYRVKHVA